MAAKALHLNPDETTHFDSETVAQDVRRHYIADWFWQEVKTMLLENELPPQESTGRATSSEAENSVSLRSLVFKAGHHGSRTSSTTPFLEAVQPQIVIISSGMGNRFGHPHPEVLERLAVLQTAVLRTDELGTITLTTDSQRLWLNASH